MQIKALRPCLKTLTTRALPPWDSRLTQTSTRDTRRSTRPSSPRQEEQAVRLSLSLLWGRPSHQLPVLKEMYRWLTDCRPTFKRRKSSWCTSNGPLTSLSSKHRPRPWSETTRCSLKHCIRNRISHISYCVTFTKRCRKTSQISQSWMRWGLKLNNSRLLNTSLKK